jgi:hypothetical protein
MDLPQNPQAFFQFLSSNQTIIMQVAALAAVTVVSTVLLRNTGLFKTIFSNWRLALLGATGVILSLASGWTTWDGMRNFTKEPLLSVMITFGIQGVMLIVAWLIGESFATGMHHRTATPSQAEGLHRRARDVMQFLQPVAGTIIGILLFAAVSILILNQAGLNASDKQSILSGDWTGFSDRLLIAAVVILLIATLVLNAGSDIIADYLQALRVITRSAVLWVMFLACMATSVFFSFDSLFSAIFPQKERERAATLRAQNQVAGVVNDIGSVAQRRRLAEQDELFQKPGWKGYERRLEQLVGLAREAPSEIEAYFERKMRERQQQVARRQQEKAKFGGEQVQLDQQRAIIEAEVKRLKAEAEPLSAEVARLKTQLFEKDREIIAKKAEAEAEAGGIGETSKVGRGPKYRELIGQYERLVEQKKNLELQRDEFTKRLEAARRRIAERETELVGIEGQITQLKGRSQTADQLIAIARKSNTTAAPQFDPADGIRQLERASIEFRQNPTKKGLERIQEVCALIAGAMAEVPTLKARARAIDCDPGQASEAAARVFALNVGIAALKQHCIGGDKLPEADKADTLFKFARSCVQDSGLPSDETERLRARINYLELNRDDKAHRFVVTSNAFQDGNKLSYLALAIAIAIDALVFMSGLFGANAVRSPLSDVPSFKGRTAHQLESVIDVALGPHAYETANQVLAALDPITPTEGFTAAVAIDRNTPHASDILRVLNAGATIGAVRSIEAGHDKRVYQVRAELFEYLSIAAKREFEKDKTHGRLAELERTISVALLPDITENAELILEHLKPIDEIDGFIAEVELDEIAGKHKRAVRSALNAGSTHRCVKRMRRSKDQAVGNAHYIVNSDFFKALVAIRGQQILSGSAPPVVPPDEDAGKKGASVQPTSETQSHEEPAASSQAANTVGARDAPTPQPVSHAITNPSGVDYWDQLIRAMGFNPDKARACLDNEAIGEALDRVGAALREQERTNQRLHRYVTDHRDRLAKGLAKKANHIEISMPSEVDQEALGRAATLVGEQLPTLQLLPESRLIGSLIKSIEKAASPDDGQLPGEQELKSALIEIQEYLEKMDVNSAASWERYADKINSLPKIDQEKDSSPPLDKTDQVDAGNVVPLLGDQGRHPKR